MAATDGLRTADKRRLLQIAREAIFSKLTRGTLPAFDVPEGPLRAPRGAFVSLHMDGELRGCIGALHPSKPLYQTVAEMAVSAATDDPRFPELTTPELGATDIEVSVLGDLERVDVDDIVSGTHGLYVTRGARRGVLLPQVATQYRWGRERFLSETCRKAGLGPDAWKDDQTVVFGFTAEVFSDTTLARAEIVLE